MVVRFYHLAIGADTRSQSKLRLLPWTEFATIFADVPVIVLSPFALATWRIYPTWLAASQVYAIGHNPANRAGRPFAYRREQEMARE